MDLSGSSLFDKIQPQSGLSHHFFKRPKVQQLQRRSTSINSTQQSPSV
jgi:hypothetical protein